MGDFKTLASIGTFQGFDGSNTSFAGAELRYGKKNWYVGGAGYIVANDFQNVFGIVDVKAKLAYDSKNIFEQNLRVRTSCGNDVNSTQIRYSPCTINIPVSDKVSIYTNTHYAGKYNYNTEKWSHSLGNFTGLNCKFDDKNSLALEAQRYNLQDIKNNSPENWSFNVIYTHNF